MSEATSEDRERLRERVREILDRTGASQRSVEAACAWSSGTLSRVFGGRKAVDAELLTALAAALDTDPRVLAEGTAFADLLEAPAEPSPAAPVEAPDPAPIPAVPAAPVSAPEPLGERPTELDDDDDGYADAPTERSPAIAAPELIVPEIAQPTPSRPPAAEPTHAEAPTTRARMTPSAPPPPPPAESAPPPPAQPIADAPAEAEGGVRGWLRSLAKRMFG